MKWLPWIVFAVFGYYLVGNNFNAKLGLIDDHEIAMFLGSDGRVSLSEIPETISHTEVGKWGSYLRYRPSYYALRVVESSLWRDNASLWYVSRYLMIVVSMLMGWKILSMYFPKIISYFFVFYTMTLPFWPDLLTRLGPSEIYAVPALLAFVYGVIKNRLWMITLGYIVCVGSKENLLILFPIIMGWAGYRIYTKKFTKRELWATLIMVGFTLFVAGAILVATRRTGTDVYGTKISYRYRVTRVIWDIPKIIQSRYMLPGILAMIIALFKKPIPWKTIGVMTIILAGIFSQYVFYVNQLPSNMRYDFPVILLFPVFDLLAVKLIISLFDRTKLKFAVKVGLYATIIVACSLYILKRGYGMVQAKSLQMVATSIEFNKQLDLAENAMKQNPNARINFVSNRYIDYEPIASVQRYLNAREVTNILSLYYSADKLPTDPMELHDQLSGVMNGEIDTDRVFDRFSKFEMSVRPCYSITFGSALPLTDCPEIAKF